MNQVLSPVPSPPPTGAFPPCLPRGVPFGDPGVIPSDTCDVPEAPPLTGASPPVVTLVVNPGVTLGVIPSDP